MLTEEIARQIVKETMTRLNRNINIMDDKGTIIASGDESRLNHIHAAARQVIETGHAMIVQSDDIGRFQGALPGINLPIEFDGRIVGVIGITGEPEEIREIGELVKMSTEMMLRQAVMQERTEWKQHAREVIFNELINGEFDLGAAERRLQILGTYLKGPYQVAVAEVNLEKTSRTELLQHLEMNFSKAEAIFGFISVQRIFILGMHMPEDGFRRKLQKIMRDENGGSAILKIGHGSIAADEQQIRYTYEEALCALKLGSEADLVSYAEIEVKALLNRLNDRARRQFADRVLNGLSAKLVETVEIFLRENLNIGKCAETMFVHRNSLNYRLKKVRELTGYDPRVFHDALTLQLAIWAQRLNGLD
ncbi:sugar diacid recognition domain-containing protein [Aciduricibacillus chroicocephali]|uniref:Sugar diacid recognition domain-containing protein n=1 Tax=Aciduricibacillus chroicocephali TaxID=3054939 RepID=A0ABY9KT74_9BACI|nr:sugar diacid recognition domain-containing protein [Bacillaceae bacterium 44XB]